MKLYFKYVSMILKSQMQYKLSFFMTAIGQFIVSFTAFLGVWFMFDRFNAVEGYTLPEVLLCFSVVLMAFSLTECFVRGFDVFPRLIKSGELDRILVRPRGVAFQVLTSNIEFSRFGRLLQAVIMLIIAIPTSGIYFSFDKIVCLVFMVIGGIATFTALFIIYAAISFFTIEGLEFMNVFTDGAREFGKYPVSIYGEGVLKFLTYVVPIALFQYYPLNYLIGKSDSVFYIFLPLFGFLLLLPALIAFRFGLSKYKSAGS